MNKKQTPRPLIAVTNDDSVFAHGLQVLIEEMKSIGDVVVVASKYPMSGKGHSITSEVPIRLHLHKEEPGCKVHVTGGTPVDCFKLLHEVVLEGRTPDILVSGINHGCNASINVLYSGTMGAAIEACMCGIPSVGFSLDDFSPEASFEHIRPFVKKITLDVLENGLPENTCLNVNFPPEYPGIKGTKVCKQAPAHWKQAFEKREDPHGIPYYWLKGNFVYESDDTNDYTLLRKGYITIVPTHFDFTAHDQIQSLKKRFEDAE